MLRRRLDRGSAEAAVNQVVDAHELLAMRESVEQVTVHEDVLALRRVAGRGHPAPPAGRGRRRPAELTWFNSPVPVLCCWGATM